ncbi:hypothetical protein FPZ52_03220 [Qingshengfaniella alkalisoli]|uniref:Uncharacterized protein n=1 Tax=Qingshengfaniella alkalisoli TaxID=2599296 RepID=A0A5B8IRB6_9RHOB|nr:hypothetical protein FPZ52_03220 [Qingshengfaniella alkalisoli]
MANERRHARSLPAERGPDGALFSQSSAKLQAICDSQGRAISLPNLKWLLGDRGCPKAFFAAIALAAKVICWLSVLSLAPAMAFWLSSPITDPAMFVSRAGGLGIDDHDLHLQRDCMIAERMAVPKFLVGARYPTRWVRRGRSFKRR